MFISSFYTNPKTVNLLALHSDTHVLSLSRISYIFLEGRRGVGGGGGGGGGEAKGWGLIDRYHYFWVCVCLDLLLTTMQRKC